MASTTEDPPSADGKTESKMMTEEEVVRKSDSGEEPRKSEFRALHRDGALQQLSSIAPKRKDMMRDRIMEGWPFTAEAREQILDYCAEDVEIAE
jgi:hypothetical protein